MIDKIMSEASHSIIGMLSAKPLGMETPTANNEFSSLLVPGETSLGSVRDKDGADTTEDKRSEEFLAQLIGDDVQPTPLANVRDIGKAVTAKLSSENGNGDGELPSDIAPAPVSEMERFVSADQTPSNLSAKASDEMARASSRDTAADRSPLVRNTIAVGNINADQKNTGKTDGPKTAAVVDSDIIAAPTENKSPAVFKPAISGNQSTDNKSALENTGKAENAISSTSSQGKQVLGIDMPKPALVVTKSTDIMPSGVSATPMVAGTERKIRDSLDLRLASKGKPDASKRPQAAETEVRDIAIAADKPMKIETKLPFVEMETFPAATQLEKNVELSASLHSTPVTGGQNTPAKTVSFDWNAPQFAQRFAAEVSDLSISGDLKKFEINPRNLGRLEVSFVSRGGAEVLQIDAESEAAREMIVQHSQAIQDMLKAQGRSDLTLRVDVRENMFAGAHNENMNFSQQDGANEQEGRPAPSSQNRGAAMSAEGDVDPPAPSDNSRYA